jgi:molybdopterin-containing oxidoreductase family iron-sulfur binding subunit
MTEELMHSHDHGHEHEHGDEHDENHSHDLEAAGQIKYWRSVDSLERTPEFVKAAREEFRAGDSEVTGLQRREMLKLMGASIALAGTGVACRRPEEKILPYTKAPEDLIPGVPNFFATARSSIFGATGLLVESHENRPTKIEGNPEHPMSMGAASSQDQATVLELYDPDRS